MNLLKEKEKLVSSKNNFKKSSNSTNFNKTKIKFKNKLDLQELENCQMKINSKQGEELEETDNYSYRNEVNEKAELYKCFRNGAILNYDKNKINEQKIDIANNKMKKMNETNFSNNEGKLVIKI